MNKKIYSIAATLLAASSLTLTSNAQRALDNFGDNTYPAISFPPGTTVSPSTGNYFSTSGVVLGGERDMSYTVTSNTPGTPYNSGNEAGFGGGNLAFSTSNVNYPNFTMTYDGADNSSSLNLSPGLGGLNMMGSGTFATRINIDAVGGSHFATVRFRVYSDATHWSDGSVTFSSVASSPDFNISIPRTDFVTGAGAAGPANFASVRAVQLNFSSTQNGLDVYFQNGITVPSPSLIAPVLSNISCSKNANVNSVADDYIQFKLLATRPNEVYTEPNSFTVTATQNGSPVAVTLQDGSPAINIKYFNDFAVPLRLANGTAGNGNVIVTATPDWGNYPGAVATLADPGSCTVPVCSLTTAPIVHTYETMRNHTDYANAQVYIPKFDASNGKILTGVTATFTSTTWSNAIAENRANNGPHQYRGRMLDTNEFFFNGALTHAFPYGDTVYRTSGYPNYQLINEKNEIPPMGMWIGDSVTYLGGVPSYKTLPRMPWISSSNFYGYNPTLSPLWVTNLTGDATSDDDMFYVEGMKTRTATKVYTAADFAAFTGTGNIPITFRNQADFAFNLGGGNNEIMLRSTNNVKVTITYTYTESCLTLSGNVYNDGNGNTNNVVNHTYSTGTGLGNPEGVQLYANLLDEKGKVVDFTFIDPSTGAYSFPDVLGGATYTVQISTNMGNVGQNAPATALPALWQNTGEQWGTTAGVNLDNTIATIDGKKTITMTGSNATNVNFGINKTPTADLKSYVLNTTPASGTIIPLDGTNSSYGATPGLLSGNDREDGSKGGVTSKFVITSLPTNGVLKYWNGISEINITAADVSNGTVFTNPANLRFQFLAQSGSWTSTTFQYAFVDNAGMTGTSNSYTINLTAGPLPVDLLTFAATVKGCNATISWTTANEVNLAHFDVEFGTDGKQFKHNSTVLVTGKNNYSYTNNQTENTGYYRLKMQDNDGSYNYSSTLKVITQCNEHAIVVYPNPASNQLNIKGATSGRQIVITNIIGQQVMSLKANGQALQTIDVSALANGTYNIAVINNNNVDYITKFSKKD